MPVVSLTSAESVANYVPADRLRPVRIWLYVIALMVLAMVVVGGITRLTDSGLSITEWQPISGIIPPLSPADWQAEFDNYKKIPQYTVLNEGMTLEAFKFIFWWEWGHRLLARGVGFLVAIPLAFFWLSGRLERRLRMPMVGLLALGGLQGALGWWMVASGLSERVSVSQYRLAIHLTFACLILSYVLWVARGLSPMMVPARDAIRATARVIVGLVLVQIFLGGLVAGLDAGMGYNTWPLMDGHLVPAGLFVQSPFWRNFFENAMTAQFDHRLVAYLVLLVTLFHAWQARGTAAAGSATILFVLVLLQACIGITTLLMAVPLELGLLHQFGAVVVLTAAVIHLRAMSPGRAGSPLPA